MGAGGLIDPAWCTATFAPILRALPPQLSEATITRPELLLCTDGPLSIYFTPFDLTNPTARVLLVGLSPGRHQLQLAIITAGAALRAGQSINQALRAAKQTASFAGSMRSNLVSMLDGIDLHHALELPSSARLFADRDDLGATTSAICHAVFRDGRNYSGAPPVDRHPLLRAFARQVLAANLAMTPEALVVPLGQAAARAVALTAVDPGRVLWEFPHRRVPTATEFASTPGRVRPWPGPWPSGSANRHAVPVLGVPGIPARYPLCPLGFGAAGAMTAPNRMGTDGQG